VSLGPRRYDPRALRRSLRPHQFAKKGQEKSAQGRVVVPKDTSVSGNASYLLPLSRELQWPEGPPHDLVQIFPSGYEGSPLTDVSFGTTHDVGRGSPDTEVNWAGGPTP
jgi:hypothetical protein